MAKKLTLRNVSGDDLHLGRPDGLPVKAGDVVAIEGQVADELDDAYVIGEGAQTRAWPKSTWKLITSGAAATSSKGADS
ncbi:hypothetical protein ACQPYK_08570 [Streptosporangium sp. CA-135522]|uniref:hypothetical protein n=1 Tax=Streptosporangium sp. CA-135522 TaxID=3240072 RepID=UPI003D8FD15D